MSALSRIDGYQRRHGWVGLPIAVGYKAADDRVPYLAALLAYYGFVALFPLLLLLFTALGFFLDGNPAAREQITSAALQTFPGLADELRENIESFGGSGWALAIGVLGTLYGGLGVMQAAQVGFNQIYGVPRNRQPNPIRSRLRGLALLALLGTGLLVSAGASVLVTTTNDFAARLGTGLRIVIFLGAAAATIALFTAAYRLLTAAELKTRNVITGGIISAACWQLLQVVGGPYVAARIETAGAVYGIFALVLAVLAWIYLQALVLVLAAETNVVIHRRLWPRALLTPFTDDVDLTEADRRVYRMHARAAAFKGFETVTADFGHGGAHPRSVRPSAR